jgi:WD40 repeat protein
MAGGVALAFAPDGKTAAVSDLGGRIRLWEIATGKEVRRLEGHQAHVTCLAFSQDGKTLASGSFDHTLGLWDVATGKSLHPFTGHQGCVLCLASAPDGNVIASGSQNHTFCLWEAKTGKLLHESRNLEEDVLSLAFSPDGRLVATGEGLHQSGAGFFAVRIWDAATGKALRSWKGHRNGVYDLAFSPDSRNLVSVGGDENLCCWEVATGRELWRRAIPFRWGTPRYKKQVWSVAYSRNGQFLVTRDEAGSIRLHEVAKGEEIRHLFGDKECPSAILLAPDSKTVFWAGDEDPGSERGGNSPPAFQMSDITSGATLRSYKWPGDLAPGHRGLTCMALSWDGRTVATADPGREIRLWEVATGEVRTQWDGGRGGTASLAFSPDGKTLVVGTGDSTILVWDLTAQALAAWAGRAAQPIEVLLNHLGSDDARDAYAALRALATVPDQAVPLLTAKLRAEGDHEERLQSLIRALDSDTFAVRESASKKLAAEGKGAAAALRRAAKSNPSPEASRRIEALLEKLSSAPDVEDALGVRVAEFLEEINTPEAKALLKEMAGGRPGATRTQEAKASLLRLTHRGTSK